MLLLSAILAVVGCFNFHKRGVEESVPGATVSSASSATSPIDNAPAQDTDAKPDVAHQPYKTTDKQRFRLALDIGHMPSAGGAVAADGKMEYDFNKRIVRLIASDLQKEPGIQVVVINPDGKRISLPGRTAMAKAANADLFLAIHHDSANDRYLEDHESNGRIFRLTDKFHGYSVFYSEKNKEHARSLEFAKSLGEAMHESGLSPTAHHAEKIQGENRELIVPRLGVYRFDDLVVLKTATMPAALLECGVIVNPSEEADLLKPERQQQTVAAVRRAVLAMKAHWQSQQESPESSPVAMSASP
jgi:N-acetylmuramoyl-L-alanine amidase